MQVIYVDVLLAVNLFVDFCLLTVDAKFLGLAPKRGRLLLGAFAGAAGSLTVLLPAMPAPLCFLTQLFLALLITLLAFGYRGPKPLLRQVISFYMMSFAFAGLMLALWYFLAPAGLFVKNSVVYFDVPPLLLVALTGVCYFALRFFHRLTGRGEVKARFCTVTVSFGGEERTLRCKVDTGCSLKEPFSGLPVVVAERHSLPPLPASPPRPVPFSSVGGDGLLRAWKPRQSTVTWEGKTLPLQDCYIAAADDRLSGGEFDALVPPELLEEIESQKEERKWIC